MRDTHYATEIATAQIGGAAIERIFVKGENQEEIRFSWWNSDGRFMTRPLDVTEEELLPLFQKAIEAGVFSATFKVGLLKLLCASLPD